MAYLFYLCTDFCYLRTMPIVTITSDWNLHDFYTGSLKGAIRSRCPNVEMIEITNQIRSFDVAQCAFVLRHTFTHFPKDSIHLMAVQSEPESLIPMVIVYHRAHYFVGLNDGRFSLLFDDPPAEATALPVVAEQRSFAALSLFPHAVAAIVAGDMKTGTKPCTLITESSGHPVYSAWEIVGRVVYIDSYGNAVTNINRSLFLKVFQMGAQDTPQKHSRSFEIFLRGPSTKLNGIAGSYDDVAAGKMLALFNSIDYLELAINKANLAQIESIDTHTEVRIKFYERKR